MIYFGKRYTSTAQGSKVKAAQCVNCQCVYAFAQTSVGTGVGISPYYLDNDGASRRAGERASRQLAKKLKMDGPAACPTCGWVQPAMVRVMKKERTPAFGVLAILSIIAAAFGLAIEAFHPVSLALYVFAFFMTGMWWLMRANFNPNKMPHERIGKKSVGMAETFVLESVTASIQDEAVLKNLAMALEDFKARSAASPKDWELRPAPLDPIVIKSEADRHDSGFKMQWAALAIATILLAGAMVPLYSWAQEEHDYAQLQRHGSLALYGIDDYLLHYPNGRHAAEVKKLREDVVKEEEKFKQDLPKQW